MLRKNLSSVTLGDSLNFVLLLDCIAVASLGSIHDFISKAFTDSLQGSEGRLSGASCNEVNGLVDSS